MKAPIWIGSRPDFVCRQFKKDLVLQPWQIAVRIQFRFETVWCVRESDKLLLRDGSAVPIATVYADGKCLVGRNDPYQIGLDYNRDAQTFRAALDQRARDAARFPARFQSNANY